VEELISEGHPALSYTLREIKVFWKALQKRKLREAKLKASLIRLAVWGDGKTWEEFFGEQKEAKTEKLINDLKAIGVLSDDRKGNADIGDKGGTRNG